MARKETDMNQEKLYRLWQAYKRLERGEWADDVLGEMPDFADEQIVRWNAMEAIEKIIGDANLTRYHHMDDLGETESEWLRWYTVGRFRYEVFTPRHYRKSSGVILPIVLLAISIALWIAVNLLSH